MRGWLAVSAFFASAPIETPPFAAAIRVRSSRFRSTIWFGRSMSSFIRSRMFVPPARNFAAEFAATSRTAEPGSAARTYLNGLIGPGSARRPGRAALPSHARQLLLVRVAPRLRRALAGVDLLDRGDDAGI